MKAREKGHDYPCVQDWKLLMLICKIILLYYANYSDLYISSKYIFVPQKLPSDGQEEARQENLASS